MRWPPWTTSPGASLTDAMAVYLIRHAHAGTRHDDEHDRYRPLTSKGRDRAATIATLLDHKTITRVLSSPATRCVQTVEPLASALDLPIVEHDDLWEGAMVGDALALLGAHAGEGIAACSHGDIIPALIEHLGRDGVPIKGQGCEKGSIWVLDHDGERWTAATKIPPDQRTPSD